MEELFKKIIVRSHNFEKKFYIHGNKNPLFMKANEDIVYSTALEGHMKEPMAVIEEFCDWADKETVKGQMWDWLMAAMGAKYAGYEEAGKRWELLFLYRRLEGLVDAAYRVSEGDVFRGLHLLSCKNFSRKYKNRNFYDLINYNLKTMENITAGDTVRHKTLIHLSGGLAFNVLDVEDDRAYCDFFDEEGINRQEWFKLTDLILVNKPEGGFFPG